MAILESPLQSPIISVISSQFSEDAGGVPANAYVTSAGVAYTTSTGVIYTTAA